MTDGETICDTRFSKCCGGVTEQFEHCWEPVPHSYLTALRDDSRETTFPDLTQEEEAQKWIRSTPDAFCNTSDKAILRQVLNNYDQETTDFYRWKISYKQEELAELILTGAGWGHGVGLCQIGAAMMAGEGYDYRQILSHYFPGAFVEKRY